MRLSQQILPGNIYKAKAKAQGATAKTQRGPGFLQSTQIQIMCPFISPPRSRRQHKLHCHRNRTPI